MKIFSVTVGASFPWKRGCDETRAWSTTVSDGIGARPDGSLCGRAGGCRIGADLPRFYGLGGVRVTASE